MLEISEGGVSRWMVTHKLSLNRTISIELSPHLQKRQCCTFLNDLLCLSLSLCTISIFGSSGAVASSYIEKGLNSGRILSRLEDLGLVGTRNRTPLSPGFKSGAYHYVDYMVLDGV